MDWIGAKVDWIKKIRFFAHPYLQSFNDLKSSIIESKVKLVAISLSI